jgi:hypothetical protein
MKRWSALYSMYCVSFWVWLHKEVSYFQVNAHTSNILRMFCCFQKPYNIWRFFVCNRYRLSWNSVPKTCAFLPKIICKFALSLGIFDKRTVSSVPEIYSFHLSAEVVLRTSVIPLFGYTFFDIWISRTPVSSTLILYLPDYCVCPQFCCLFNSRINFRLETRPLGPCSLPQGCEVIALCWFRTSQDLYRRALQNIYF